MLLRRCVWKFIWYLKFCLMTVAVDAENANIAEVNFLPRDYAPIQYQIPELQEQSEARGHKQTDLHRSDRT
jgi:hypothetical protein